MLDIRHLVRDTRHSVLATRNLVLDTRHTGRFEGLERAEELNNLIGDELDPQGEQDKDEDSAEGIVDHPNFLHADPNNLEGVPEKTKIWLVTGIKISL